MSLTELTRIVREDLEYIRDTWRDISEASLRRGSVTLRRLLIDDELLRAWKAVGFKEGFTLKAPRADTLLESPESGSIHVIISGGGMLEGMTMGLATINAGRRAIKVMNGNPMEHSFRLKEFMSSTSIYVERTKISRHEIINYVANKLGGAHTDFTRGGGKGLKQSILDRNVGKFRFGGQIPSKFEGVNAVYFELLFIGQLVALSEDAGRFLETAS